MLLDKMGIFDLRNYARYIGVPNATTMNKEQIQNLVLEKLKNGRYREDYKNSLGRPTKIINAEYYKELHNKILGELMIDKQSYDIEKDTIELSRGEFDEIESKIKSMIKQLEKISAYLEEKRY